MNNKKVLLLILDGLGVTEQSHGNAVTKQTMPTFYDLMQNNSVAKLEASGEAVGLASDQVGNSEVGHATIGAGRVLKSKLAYMSDEYDNGNWGNNPYWQTLKQQKRIHISGVLSEAGVHAHIDAMIQTIKLAVSHEIAEINLHLFLDGLDSAAGSAPGLLAQLQQAISAYPQVRIGLVMGRIWAADRSGDLSVTQRAVDAMQGKIELAEFNLDDLNAHIETSGSERDFTPSVINRDALVKAGEHIILTNHRSDRAKQLCEVLLNEHQVYTLADLTSVDNARVFFPQEQVHGGLVDSALAAGLQIEVVAEACKFKHVTYFLNGFKENDQVSRTEIPTIDDQAIRLNPAMSIEALEGAINSALDRKPDLMCVNIPNLDQVGHTGDLALTEQAAVHVDNCLKRVLEKALNMGYNVAVTADHGNADAMLSAEGKPLVSHSANPVPLFIVRERSQEQIRLQPNASLPNLAPTLLKLMDLPVPEFMHPDIIVH